MPSWEGADGGKSECIGCCTSFFVLIGIAEALASKGGEGEGGDMPAGDAIEVGNMKSSMFIASGSGVSNERSRDSRSFAMPEGALADC